MLLTHEAWQMIHFNILPRLIHHFGTEVIKHNQSQQADNVSHSI